MPDDSYEQSKSSSKQYETERVKALEEYGILDSGNEKEFDDLARLASEICGTRSALITFIDSERQYFKAKHQINSTSTEIKREQSFCRYTIMEEDVMVVEDASHDTRFKDNPLVKGDPKIRFYGGAPIVTEDGFAIGSICAIDYEARQLNDFQKNTLKTLANEVYARLELKRQKLKLEEKVDERTREIRNTNDELRREIQKNQEVNDQLAKNEAYYWSLIKNSYEIISVFDEDGFYKFTSPSIHEILGYTPEYLIGRSVFDFIHQADHEKILKLRSDLQKAKNIKKKALLRFMHADGEYRLMEFVAQNALEDSAVEGIVVNTRDVTEEYENLQKLRASERDYRGLFENAHDPILILDAESETILNANPPAFKTYGYTREELIGMHLKNLAKNSKRAGLIIQQLSEHKQPRKFETTQIDKNGNAIIMEVNANVIQYQGRKAILSITRDITSRKQLEKDLRAKNKELNEFLYSTSHDLKSPVSTIEGLVQIGKSESGAEDEYYAYIEKALGQLKNTLHKLTSVAGIDRRNVQTKSLQPNALVQKTLDLLADQYPDIKKIVTWDSGSYNALKGDEYLLSLILYELLENAYLFQINDEVHNPETMIELQPTPEMTAIVIKDNGPGLNKIHELFDMFLRDSPHAQGSGLGLYLVKNAVDKLGGTVEAKNRPERGAEFRIGLKND